MLEQDLAFHVGDQIIHGVYGPGVILRLEEKQLSGEIGRYYVVQIRDLTLWVPANEKGEQSLRFPTPAKEFKKLFRILAAPAEELADDRMERKMQLIERLKDSSLESVCGIIRDLTYHKRFKKMNDHDNTVLERATSFLLNEWSLSMSVSVQQAEQELKELLANDHAADKES